MRLSIIDESYLERIIKMESGRGTSEFIIPYSAETHLAEIRKPANRYLGIFSAGEFLGFFILGIEMDGERIEFRRIVIENKGSGYGKRAIIELEEFCKALWNTKSIWLDVFDFNERGIHIYQKLGYVETGRSSFDGKNLVVMEKRL